MNIVDNEDKVPDELKMSNAVKLFCAMGVGVISGIVDEGPREGEEDTIGYIVASHEDLAVPLALMLSVEAIDMLIHSLTQIRGMVNCTMEMERHDLLVKH